MTTTNKAAAGTYEFGEFRLDTLRMLLFRRNGESVPLPPKAFDLLLTLIAGGGRVLAKDELLKEVWRGIVVEEGNLTQTISILRKALGESRSDHRYIVTVPGRGYRFVAVTRTPPAAPEGETSGEASEPAARYETAYGMSHDLPQFAGARKRPSWTSRRWVKITALCLVVPIILVVVLARALRRRAANSDVPPFSIGSVRRITDTAGSEIFPSLSPDGQTIVYASRASGNWDIYLQKVGELQAVNLTGNSPHVELAPAFSPDGTRIAFHSSREGGGIYLMDRNGQNVTRLSTDGHNPAWSPDNREIAIADDRVFDYEGRSHSPSRLSAVNVQTGARRLITESDAVQPNWSPHGHRIAYWGVHQGGRRDIWTIAARGGEPIAVTDDQAVDWNPVWARDGRHLYFLSNRGGSMNLWRVPIDELSGRVAGPPEPATLPSASSQHLSFSVDGRAVVYVEMNRRENTWQVSFDPATGNVGGSPVQLTRGVRRYSNPELSPDEKSIVFVSQGEAQEDVFVITRDGAELRQLTDDLSLDRIPRWSPDGQQLAFLSDRNGKYEIWRMNQNGGDLERLTDVPEADVLNPVWAPDGRRLLYQVRGINSYVIEPGRPRAVRTPQPLAGQQIPGFLPWSWSPDGKLLAGWQSRTERPNGGVVIYSFAAPRYERLTDRGRSPLWLNDNRQLIFADLGKIYLLDILTKQWREIYSVEPDNLGTFMLSRDNRRLYYSLFSSESDVWLLPLK